jgi:hypothetical protein
MIADHAPARRDVRRHPRRGVATVGVVLMALACLALAPAVAAADSITLAYPLFASNMSGLQVNPDAHREYPVVALTDAAPGQVGSFFTKQKVALGASRSFSAFFTIGMSDDGGDPADGMCFVIQQSAAEALGANGGGLGYQGIPGGSLAIEFDPCVELDRQRPRRQPHRHRRQRESRLARDHESPGRIERVRQHVVCLG